MICMLRVQATSFRIMTNKKFFQLFSILESWIEYCTATRCLYHEYENASENTENDLYVEHFVRVYGVFW